MGLIGFTRSWTGGYGLFGNESFTFEVSGGLIALIGPNGTGKSRILETIAQNLVQAGLPQNSIRLLAAGRTAPIEQFRVKVTGSHNREGKAHLGHRSWTRQGSETIAGDVMAMMERKDLLLKVQCRLEQLFDRRVILQWSQQGIEVSFRSKYATDEYSAVGEATGLLQLICLMAAFYDDDTKALLIDEPELGLHPQLQAFVLQEALNVSGDPLADPSRKLVLFATHSPSMLSLEQASDLSSMYFFNTYTSAPVRLSATAPVLAKAEARGLIARLGEAYKIAFFARTVLLVEGPSDRIVVHAVARRLGAMLGPSSVEIVPIVGNGDLPIAVELFASLGKRVVVLTDLDTVVDGTELVDSLRRVGEADKHAQEIGHSDFKRAFKSVRDQLFSLIESDWPAISELAERHPYWTQRERGVSDGQQTPNAEQIARRRAAAAALLTATSAELIVLPTAWQGLGRQLSAMLGMAEQAGLFILRRGRIEDYYTAASRSRKPSAAAEEAQAIKTIDPKKLKQHYQEISQAIDVACTTRPVDEVAALRSAIAGVASRVLMLMTKDTTPIEMARLAADDPYSSMMTFANASENDSVKLTIGLKSKLFDVAGLPITISKNEPLNRLEQEIKPAERK